MLVRLSERLISQFLSIVSGSLSRKPAQLIRLPVRLIKSKIPRVWRAQARSEGGFLGTGSRSYPNIIRQGNRPVFALASYDVAVFALKRCVK